MMSIIVSASAEPPSVVFDDVYIHFSILVGRRFSCESHSHSDDDKSPCQEPHDEACGHRSKPNALTRAAAAATFGPDPDSSLW